MSEQTEIVPPPSQRILRYMDFSKFVWLLAKRALWFTRRDQFEDPWEQFYTAIPYGGRGNRIAASRYVYAQLAEAAQHTFVSSWSLTESESYLMWRAYGAAASAVAVESTTGRLWASILDAKNGQRHTDCREVEYCTEPELIARLQSENDHNRGIRMGSVTFLRYAFLKRSFFAEEREWRAALYENDVEPVRGIAVPVDPTVLITGVIVSPIAEACFQEAVDSVLEKWGLPLASRRSGLTSSPPKDPALKPLPNK